ncbi:MAG TPA: LPS-assembly protein LptD [Bacteroidetes bacterium]|nr:LPS-assembly protein LptD [Bacteroidota bacterium]
MKLYFLILFLFLINSPVFSQSDESNDTATSLTDSVISNVNDSLVAQSDINGIINYSAVDSAVFDFKTDKLYLYNNAEVTYQDLKLNSGIIIIDRETQILEAIGIPDSLDNNNIVQLPLMFQGETKYEGSILRYNFKTQQGTVSMGYSDAEIGYYFGEKIKKVDSDIFFIKNGIYTTSTNKEDPEYYFLSPEMKVITDDKIIAKSVFLYIEGVPVFWLPFAIFPDRGGRSSGLIPPTFGDDATYGQYISKFGYYWAINDYLDVNGLISFFTRGRIDFSSRFRYALRYNFTGEVNAGYSRIRLGDDQDFNKFSSDEYLFSLVHSQSINPTTQLNANMTFVSGQSYYDNSSNNLNQLLRQNVISNLTLSKFWEGTPFSLSLNYSRDQNLVNGDIRENLPAVLFSNSTTFPFRDNNTTSFNSGNFYEYISYSYNGNFQHRRTKLNFVNSFSRDTTVRDSRLGFAHNVNLNFSPPSSNINITPFFNYTELWYTKSVIKSFNPIDSTVTTTDVEGFKPVRYFNTGVSVNTKLVGIFNPQIFNVTGIRHTITPSISYSYRPDFSNPSFGYFGTYVNQFGTEVKYSFFEREIFGGAPSGEEQSVNFNLNNLFEMKIKENDSVDNKFKLIEINAGAGYNFAADSLKLSELRTNFNTQIGQILNIGGSASFNFYKFDPVKRTRVNIYLWDSENKIADLTNFNINASTSYNFEFSNRENENDTLNRNPKEIEYFIPFTGTLNYNYSESKFDPLNVFRSSNLSGNLQFNLTQKWKLTFTASYDLLNKQINAPYITAYRDLNSWEANFNWYPTGSFKGFRFEVRIKAPQLQDVKITKQTSNRGVFGDF